jgi:hypothetical protein
MTHPSFAPLVPLCQKRRRAGALGHLLDSVTKSNPAVNRSNMTHPSFAPLVPLCQESRIAGALGHVLILSQIQTMLRNSHTHPSFTPLVPLCQDSRRAGAVGHFKSFLLRIQTMLYNRSNMTHPSFTPLVPLCQESRGAWGFSHVVAADFVAGGMCLYRCPVEHCTDGCNATQADGYRQNVALLL